VLFSVNFNRSTDKPGRLIKPKQTPNAQNQAIAGQQGDLQAKTNFTGITNFKKSKGSNSPAFCC
jgi:hypothetical protein